MEHLAALYMANGCYDAALGPLARALQLDPRRRSLWAALDTALRRLGRQRMSDEELAMILVDGALEAIGRAHRLENVGGEGGIAGRPGSRSC